MERNTGPADETAVCMADERGVRITQGANQSDDVAGEGPPVVSAWRLVGVTVSAQVDGDGADTRARKRLEKRL